MKHIIYAIALALSAAVLSWNLSWAYHMEKDETSRVVAFEQGFDAGEDSVCDDIRKYGDDLALVYCQ